MNTLNRDNIINKPKNYMLIACAVLYRECYYCASLSKNTVDIQIIEQGLHDIGEKKMSAKLQEIIDGIDHEKYDAILLGYGLCNMGVRGLNSKIKIVIPRAHDCITLLIGSKEKYKKYFDNNPGTFYRSPGWIEKSKSNLLNPESTTVLMGMSDYKGYVEKYGEENARYIIEKLGGGLKNYSKLTYIDTGIVNPLLYEKEQKKKAKEEGWEFEIIEGSLDLLLNLVNGKWNEEDFLVVNPGETIEPSYDLSVIKKVKK